LAAAVVARVVMVVGSTVRVMAAAGLYSVRTVVQPGASIAAGTAAPIRVRPARMANARAAAVVVVFKGRSAVVTEALVAMEAAVVEALAVEEMEAMADSAAAAARVGLATLAGRRVEMADSAVEVARLKTDTLAAATQEPVEYLAARQTRLMAEAEPLWGEPFSMTVALLR
jgi:hypothetical protein